jgi:hypothetical protein
MLQHPAHHGLASANITRQANNVFALPFTHSHSLNTKLQATLLIHFNLAW